MTGSQEQTGVRVILRLLSPRMSIMVNSQAPLPNETSITELSISIGGMLLTKLRQPVGCQVLFEEYPSAARRGRTRNA